MQASPAKAPFNFISIMPGVLDIQSHLVFYRKYHFNNTNVAIHLICIPLILLSAICFSIGVVILKSYPYVTLGVIVAWVYGLFYILLDWQLGFPTFLFLAGYAHLQRTVYLQLTSASLLLRSLYTKLAVGVHIVCWLAQFYGHAVHEKRAPALLDNLLQAVVLAPFFVVYEIAFWMGFKLQMKHDMDNEAGKLRHQMIKADKEKKKA